MKHSYTVKTYSDPKSIIKSSKYFQLDFDKSVRNYLQSFHVFVNEMFEGFNPNQYDIAGFDTAWVINNQAKYPGFLEEFELDSEF